MPKPSDASPDELRAFYERGGKIDYMPPRIVLRSKQLRERNILRARRQYAERMRESALTGRDSA